MKHLNDAEMREKLRVFIAVNYKTKINFAKNVGCSSAWVSNVLNGQKRIPDEWLELIGYESVTIYRKVKKGE